MDINQFTFDAAFDNGAVTYPIDCERICAVAATMGIAMTPRQADEVWDCYSGRRCAQWLTLQDDEEIKDAIRSFVEHRLET